MTEEKAKAAEAAPAPGVSFTTKDVKSMTIPELGENLPETKKEYLARAKPAAEEFVHRTYKLNALRSSLQLKDRRRRDSGENVGSANMIHAMVESNLLRKSIAHRYLEKKPSKCTLKTSLPEDLFGFVNTQLTPVMEALKDQSNHELLLQIVQIYINVLIDTQTQHREELLNDHVECCASANDLMILTKKTRDLQTLIVQQCSLDKPAIAQLQEIVDPLITLYTNNSDYAAQKVSFFLFEEVEQDLNTSMRGHEFIQVEQITTLLDRFLPNLQDDLDASIMPKTLQALVTKYVLYYLEKLLQTASAHKSLKDSFFKDNARALNHPSEKRLSNCNA